MFGMELTLADHTDQHDTQISVTCDGQFSHTFDLLTLVPNDENHLPQPFDDPIAYGKAIYLALFPAGTLAQQTLSKGPERLLLVLTDEALDAIAWEYAYSSTGFLVLDCRIVRGLPIEQRIDPPILDDGLHIVAVPSNPLSEEVRALNIEGEWLRLKEVIKGVATSLTLERTRPATIDQLRSLVAHQRNRVVHFMGHGQQTATGGTVLCFEKDNGDLERVAAKQFALRMQGTVFLITLNACESATAHLDVFGNLAATLVRQQTPYALGMRSEISDEDARAFARKFYGELAHGSAVEEALFQARWSLTESKQPWAIGIPVLYTSLKAAAPAFKTTEGIPIIQEYQPRLDLYALPRVVGTFQGRLDALKALGTDLTGDSRPGIVTIHGGGGQGKTALAREAVERFAYAWPDGVWATSLEHLPSRGILAADLARFLGIATQAILDPKELERQVLERLALLRTLLVLDNAETLVEAIDTRDPAAINLAEFLQRLPGASVSLLVTSRIPLGWNGEVAHELGGLSAQEGAVLFQQSAPQRSQAIGTPQEVARAEGLSKTLEGHPLSLRLLGSTFNASTLPLNDFIAQYETELEQAENKYIGLAHRQRTLNACIETSTRNLDAQLRALLSGLWIFQAPFLPQAAVAIFDAQSGNTAQSAVYEQLRTLQQRSLLVQETLTADNETRQLYHLLPTTRPYVEHQLAQAYERKELLQCFGAQYARFVEDLFNNLAFQAIAVTLARRTYADLKQGKDYVTGIQQGYYLLHWAWILQRLGNTRYAQELLEQALQIAQQEDTQQSIALQAFVLDYMGIIAENTGAPEGALSIYEQQVLPLLDEVKDQASKAAILTNMAGVYQEIGQHDRAIQLYNQALTLRREVHDRSGEATTLNNLAWAYQLSGELDTALNLYQQQVLPLRREVQDRAGEAITLNNIAGVYDLLGLLDQALDFYQQALPLYRAMGDRFGEATALNGIGLVYQKIGRFNEALKYHQLVEPIRIEVNDQVGLAATYNNFGAAYQRMGQPDTALKSYQLAIPLIRKAGDRRGESITLSNMAMVSQTLGHNDQALDYNQQALSIMREIKNRPGEGITLNNLGRLYQNIGQFEQALDSYQQALPIMREIGNHAIEAVILKNMATLLNDHLNRQAEALSCMKQAIAVLEQAGLKQDALGRTVEALRQVLDGMRTNQQPPQAQ